VDDHAFVRRGIKSLLGAFPEWNVCGEAENGRDAIRLAAELKPDVVLLDVSMPGVSGLEAARTIHEREPHTRIILLTLHDSKELVRSAFRIGVNGYLLKADADQELIRALRIVSESGTYLSPKIDPNLVNGLAEK
jgi:DNA-binding NarL/FixJ family response regulator